ncbi:programmed cell death protein 7 [Ochlerotatus camptorhynchus]|uniref:programmed cell death protein 7 n=1 Tax=Ochlerotatus camptorhynchus TaxID=644619 RepID=UPI0031DEE43C
MSSLPFFDPTRPPPAFPPPTVRIIDPFCDQDIVQEFLSTKRRSTSSTAKAKQQPSAASISKLRSELVDLMKEVERLKTQKETLEKEIESQPDSQWQASFAQLEQTQQSIASKLTRLNDSELRSQLAKKLHARRKKREWQKRWSSRLKQEKAEAMQNRTKLHEQIDQWQREQWKLVEKEKQAQHELDFTSHFLADVHRRKAACKRYLAKFEKMKDREPSAEFSELTRSWTARLSECVKEEIRLKDVLARRSAANYQRRVENEWTKALFGDTIPKKFEHPLLGADRSRGVLIETRQAWDACLVEVDDDEASAIPLGWVLPPANPTADWAKYQMKEVI